MAERRMISKRIADSDAFLDMPLSAQALYFHLCMRADDDGFVNGARRIQRMVGAAEDDARLLITKGFLIMFPSGVVVIKHWKLHNYIPKDRHKPTAYQEELATLNVKNNGAYTLKTAEELAAGPAPALPDPDEVETENRKEEPENGPEEAPEECGDGLYTVCIQNVDGVYTQDRLGKVRLGEDRIGEEEDARARATSPASFALANNAEYRPADDQIAKWVEAFPGLDVERELMQAAQKNNAKPPNQRKNVLNVDLYIVNWLINADGRRKKAAAPPGANTRSAGFLGAPEREAIHPDALIAELAGRNGNLI